MKPSTEQLRIRKLSREFALQVRAELKPDVIAAYAERHGATMARNIHATNSTINGSTIPRKRHAAKSVTYKAPMGSRAQTRLMKGVVVGRVTAGSLTRPQAAVLTATV
jgi:hypothetical protein